MNMHRHMEGSYVYFTKKPFQTFKKARADTGGFLISSASLGSLFSFARKGIESGLFDNCQIKSRGLNFGSEFPLLILETGPSLEPFLRDIVYAWNMNYKPSRRLKIHKHFWQPHKTE
ncbi:hypothetical protein SFC65_20005 [Priestia filamentosa]|uniref:hypothetical protein n=1 Tax=Priestia filamentosa TaxID=1402861 RepID=UPI0039820CD6